MPGKQSPEQKEVVERFKHGELKAGPKLQAGDCDRVA